MPSSSSDFLALLDALCRHGVCFIIVGGVSAVLNGAPIVTLDLDIVHERSEENIERLLATLEELGAVYRQRPALKPDISHLRSEGHQLLITKAGPLDVLGAIGDGQTYDDLLPFTQIIEVASHHLHILNLEKLIEIKEQVGRDKDRLMLPLLRHTLAAQKP